MEINKTPGRELKEIIEVYKTPIKIVGGDNEYFPVLGKWRLTEDVYETSEELEDRIKSTDWQLIMNVIGVMIEDFFNNLNTEENEQ